MLGLILLKRFTEPVHKRERLTPTRVDIHQHLWPEPLLRCLCDGASDRDRPLIPAVELALGLAVEGALRERSPSRLLGAA